MDDDKAQIAEVLIRYATGIDSKDWALFRTCWTDDVDVDYGDLGHFENADTLTDLMTRIHDGMGPTYHRISNLAILVDGDRATARSYVHALLMSIPGDSSSWVDALGHYDDELVRTPDGWRIDKRSTHIAGAQRCRRGSPVVTEAFARKYGPWALIAGASEGIGASLAGSSCVRTASTCAAHRSA